MLLAVLVLGSLCLNGAVQGWTPAAALFAATSNYFTDPFFFRSPWLSSQVLPPNRPAESKPTEIPEATQVRRLISATHNKLSYIMVENVTLGFEQAESYCQTKFSDPMHLVSVHSEVEWVMLANTFGKSYPMDIWLGGTIRHPRSKLFELSWIDHSPVDYHRFSSTEQQRWVSNWRVHSHGCIVANLESSQLGNWSVEFAPCTTPRAFVCKEHRVHSEPSTPHVRLVTRHFSPLSGDAVALGDLMERLMFPNRRIMFPRLELSPVQRFSFSSNGGRFSNHRVIINEQSKHFTTPEPSQIDATVTKASTPTKLATEQTGLSGVTPSALSQSEEPAPPTHVYKNNTDVTEDTKNGTIAQHDSDNRASTRIIRIAKPQSPQSDVMPPNLTKEPKFILFNGAPRSQSEVTVVRMPIPKSNAQVIYPRTIWDLA